MTHVTNYTLSFHSILILILSSILWLIIIQLIKLIQIELEMEFKIELKIGLNIGLKIVFKITTKKVYNFWEVVKRCNVKKIRNVLLIFLRMWKTYKNLFYPCILNFKRAFLETWFFFSVDVIT